MTALTSDKAEAKKKGLMAAGALGGSVALVAFGWPIVGGMGIAGGAYLTYKWFMFRAKRGMRF